MFKKKSTQTKVYFICKRCKEEEWYWSDFTELLKDMICINCRKKEREKEEEKEDQLLKERQDKCNHQWFVLKDGECDFLKCPKCDKNCY